MKTSSFTGYLIASAKDDIVAFTAVVGNILAYTNGQIIVFDYNSTNIGGRYSTKTGRFECSDNSLYMFLWSVSVMFEEKQRPAEARLMMTKGGVEKEVKAGPKSHDVLPGEAKYSSPASTQVIAQCEPDRAFYVQIVVPDGSKQYVGATYSSFSGFQLPPK